MSAAFEPIPPLHAVARANALLHTTGIPNATHTSPSRLSPHHNHITVHRLGASARAVGPYDWPNDHSGLPTSVDPTFEPAAPGVALSFNHTNTITSGAPAALKDVERAFSHFSRWRLYEALLLDATRAKVECCVRFDSIRFDSCFTPPHAHV